MPAFRIGHRQYRTKGAAGDAIREIRDRYPVGSAVDQVEDHKLLRDLIDLHEHAAEKIGCGIEAFVIDRPLRGRHSGFRIIRTDGTEIDFSYLACLSPPHHRQQVLNAMRAEITENVSAYFASRAAGNSLRSDLSGTPLDSSDAHVSYFRGPAFVDIATWFADEIGGWESVDLTSSRDAGAGKFRDRSLAERWTRHHGKHAVLGLLTPQENLRRTH
ncbi:DCL family protein [Streptomyces sp. NPDC058195]|uniref:DCL family protein n=1 Tax=Streptomyces sp. NPDC058195 TaxID=3346375 RepID=UPI0036E2F2FE